MNKVEFQLSDKVRLKPGSGNWDLYVGYRGMIGEIEFVRPNSNQSVERASVAFANRQPLKAVPVEDLELV